MGKSFQSQSEKKMENMVDQLYASILKNKISSTNYMNVQANMIHSYWNITHKFPSYPNIRDFYQFYQELNNIIAHFLEKEPIVYKKIEAINAIQFYLLNSEQYHFSENRNDQIEKDHHLYHVVIEYQKSINRLLKALLNFNENGHRFFTEKNSNHQKLIHLILKLLDNLYEAQRIEFKKIEFFYTQDYIVFDDKVSDILIDNIETNILLTKHFLLNNFFSNKDVLTSLRKRIMSLIRFKNEISRFEESTRNQNLPSPWISNLIKKDKEK